MSETRKLYYEDVYQKEFTAEVLECRETDRGYEVVLDQTAFYPEGGGQPCDLGTLNGISVVDVQEKGSEIVHYTEKPLETGSKVTGKIDWARRFDLMQQHSGEHIVSGLVHEAYGYDNVGFHMSSDVITVDFSGVLTETQLAEIEAETNQKIWENTPVEIFYPPKEELEKLSYRSKKELTGQVRLVRFPGSDLCACCGTHVTHTGEIGAVKTLPAADDAAPEEETKREPNIVTTEEELEAYFIVKNLLVELAVVHDITYKDTESYMNVLYKGNTRKWICRLRLTDSVKYLIVPDENKKETKYALQDIYDIRQYGSQLEEVLKRYL